MFSEENQTFKPMLKPTKALESHGNDEATIETLTEKILSLKEETEYNFVEIGKLLIKAKEVVGHGNFLNWLENNVEMSTRTAHRFMSVAKVYKKLPPVADLGYSKACIMLSLLVSGKKVDEKEKYVRNTHRS